MLVLPDGMDKTWAHRGSPSQARDEIAFMDAVRADLLARWPVEPAGSWSPASRRAARWSGISPASAAGTTAPSRPSPAPSGSHCRERCDGGPVDLLHIHGTADNVVPMAGRPIGDKWRQGDVLQGLASCARSTAADAAEPARRR